MNCKDVFILGAGFSKAINSEMPTMKELTSEVNEKIKYSELTLPPPLKNPDNEELELENNIELWMTYLSQSQPWLDESYNQSNKAISTRIRRYIRDIIDDYTKNVMNPSSPSDNESSMPEWLKSLIGYWHNSKASVITLNYDTLVERSTIALKHLDTTYDSGISLGNIYPPYFSRIMSRHQSLVGHNSLKTYKYLKLHGSVNWHYSGTENFYGETIFYSSVSPWGPRNDHERESLQSAKDKQPLIIPPVSEKTIYFNNESIRGLWREASEDLQGATRVIVIGYSLPISDLGMQFFLKHSLPIVGTSWYIVDPDIKALQRFRHLLEPGQKVLGDYTNKDNPVHEFVNSDLLK